MRISQGPHAALNISESASAEEVRAAFLELTKQFHPARFGRMSNDIHRTANEVFLGIKGAHDQLIKLLGSSGRPARSASAVPNVAPTPGGTVRGVGLVPRAQSSQPIARGTDRPGARPQTPVLTTPSGGVPRAATPVGMPAPGRTPTPQAIPPMARTTPAAGVPIQRPSAPAIDAPERRLTPPGGMPAQPRPGSPASTPDRRMTPASGIPVQRPVSPSPSAQPRPASPVPATHARPITPPASRPPEINPPTIRYSGVQPRGGQTNEETELKNAMSLLSSKDWSAARQAFHALAAKVPQSRHYRALLCYARGRETQATGRTDDAQLEFQRALQLDPDLELAKVAIREVQRKSRW